MNLGSPQNVLIKTYVHESGLWYLALSLAEQLENAGHKVKFVPKSKYVKDEIGLYRRTYFPAIQSDKVLPMSVEYSTNVQLLRYVYQHKIETIISLETMMESASWVGELKKKTQVQIIDIPMLEWVTTKFFKGGNYNQFDKIWAVTNQTYNVFRKKYPEKTERVEWDFVDHNIFAYDPNPFGQPEFSFYHQGSLNAEHSSKNTDLVLLAFEKLDKEFPKKTRMIVTGNLTDSNLRSIVNRHPNIRTYDRVLSRQEVANIYSITNCVVAPSSKEGLSLSLFEAEACGCLLITTDAPPMNEHHTDYLCEIANLKKDKSLVAVAELTVDSIYEQMKKAYEENNYE